MRQSNVVILRMMFNIGVVLTKMCSIFAGKALMMVVMLTIMKVVMLTMATMAVMLTILMVVMVTMITVVMLTMMMVVRLTMAMVVMLAMAMVVMLTMMVVVIALGRRVRVQRAAAKAVKSSSAVIEEAGGRWRRDYLMIGLDPSSPSDRLTSSALQIL